MGVVFVRFGPKRRVRGAGALAGLARSGQDGSGVDMSVFDRALIPMYRATTTASCTAVWTIAITRTAGGVPIRDSTINSPARVFQSMTVSARAVPRPAAIAAAVKQSRVMVCMMAP